MEKKFIRFREVDYIYNAVSNEGLKSKGKALNNVNITLDEGQYILLLGRNASGKSTFAKIINTLIFPSKGTIYIDGLDTKLSENLWILKNIVGMVFQNPENQIVGSIVEEDVSFAPENMGIDPLEIRKRVNESLAVVGMSELAKSSIHMLSGGQKQLVAIAGVLAMIPKCIVLDESTSMLDPVARKEVLEVLSRLNKDKGITIIHITHFMDEIKMADRVLVLDKGEIVLDGTPDMVFSDVPRIKELGLDIPQVTDLFYQLENSGILIDKRVYDVDTALECLCNIMGEKCQ